MKELKNIHKLDPKWNNRLCRERVNYIVHKVLQKAIEEKLITCKLDYLVLMLGYDKNEVKSCIESQGKSEILETNEDWDYVEEFYQDKEMIIDVWDNILDKYEEKDWENWAINNEFAEKRRYLNALWQELNYEYEDEDEYCEDQDEVEQKSTLTTVCTMYETDLNGNEKLVGKLAVDKNNRLYSFSDFLDTNESDEAKPTQTKSSGQRR